jgi:alanine dehydrogenase
MTLGIPKETKEQECRVALPPPAVATLVREGHPVVVQHGAGTAAGFTDEQFVAAGAQCAECARDVFAAADVVVKVKEPLEPEFAFLRPGLGLFCYLHSETRPALVEALLAARVTAIAFENVRLPDGSLPLLAPMSVIAGQQAILQAAALLCNHRGGPGLSLVAYPGLERARVVVIGAGNAGVAAARVAAALGAEVDVFEVSPTRIRALEPCLPPGVRLYHAASVPLADPVRRADMVVQATSLPPNCPTHLIDRDLVRSMKPGSIIVDITANLRGAVETVDRYTTHDAPVYHVDGIAHYVVPNIPGTVARTASQALAMEVLPYVQTLARHGLHDALVRCPALRAGLTCMAGALTWHEAGSYLKLPWLPPDEALGLAGTVLAADV